MFTPAKPTRKRTPWLESGSWKQRFIDYFAVCGLGLGKNHVELEGRFHSGRLFPGEEPLTPFSPECVDRFPEEDNGRFELPGMLSSCVLPYGVRLYSHGSTPLIAESMPKLYPVVLTDTKGVRVYVAALSFRDRVGDVLGRIHDVPADCYADKVICIVSHFPFLDLFQDILQELHRVCFLEEGCPVAFWDLVKDLFSVPVPGSEDTTVLFTIFHTPFSVTLPDPSSPRALHVSFQPLVESLDVDSILQLFAALLVERKVLLVGCNLKLLTVVAEGLMALLWPFKWMPIYVPVLPAEALECLDAPVSFLYGVSSDQIEIKTEELDGVVVADLNHSVVKLITGSARPELPLDSPESPQEEQWKSIPEDSTGNELPASSSSARLPTSTSWSSIRSSGSVKVAPLMKRMSTKLVRRLKVVSRLRDIRNQPSQTFSENGDADDSFSTIPELPEGSGDKLRKTLCSLIRPNVSTLTTVAHASSLEEQEDEDLLLGLTRGKWGKQHDERFQLAFVRFMAELLRGYKQFMVKDGQDAARSANFVSYSLSDIIDGPAFLAMKKEEQGWEAEALLKQIMSSQAWPMFLAEHVIIGKHQSLLDDFIDAIGTPAEKRVTFPREKPILNFLTVCKSSAKGETEGAPNPVVNEVLPESPACVLIQVRKELKEREATRMDAIAEMEWQSKLELMKLDYMARLCYYLDSLTERPTDEQVLDELKQMIKRGQDDPVITDCFIKTVQERYSTRGPREIPEASFFAFTELMNLGLDVLSKAGNFTAAAQMVELGRNIVMKDKDGERTRMYRHLKRLDLWQIPEFWIAMFEHGVEQVQMDGEEVPDLRMHVLNDLVKVMAEVGLSEAQVSDTMECVAGGLSVKKQILLRNHFVQLQFLSNPIARSFIRAMSSREEGRSQSMPRRNASKGAERWVKAVILVKERIAQGEALL